MGPNTNHVAAPEPSTFYRIERRMAELLALCPHPSPIWTTRSPASNTLNPSNSRQPTPQLADHGFIHRHTAPTAGRSRTVRQAKLEELRSIEEERLRN